MVNRGVFEDLAIISTMDDYNRSERAAEMLNNALCCLHFANIEHLNPVTLKSSLVRFDTNYVEDNTIWPKSLVKYVEEKYRGSGVHDRYEGGQVSEDLLGDEWKWTPTKEFPTNIPEMKIQVGRGDKHKVRAITEQTYMTEDNFQKLLDLLRTVTYNTDEVYNKRTKKWTKFVSAYLDIEAHDPLLRANIFGDWKNPLTKLLAMGFLSELK